MRVTRLEIFGFKSFVDRFVLNFDKNMIGIVGPNGCGKSNVVDALRWVLGETHAKQLRGAVFDDLIFNGSQSRRPLGMAEVSITIRPSEKWSPSTVTRVSAPGLDRDIIVSVGDATMTDSEGATTDVFLSAEELQNEAQQSASKADSDAQGDSSAAPAASDATSLFDIPGLFDTAEIQLTRRLYRSGESEYFINRVPCRLRDMIEFYRMIGLGSRGLSIVQQGQVAEIISKKPLERRELIEEAAGIAGFRSRIETAERKLERTRENISRLNDIVLEVEKQVKTLGRQAKRARDRAELKSKLKSVELELFDLKIALIDERSDRDTAAIETNRIAIDDRERELNVLEAKEIDHRSELDIVESRLGDLRRKKDEIVGELARRHSAETALQLETAKAEGRAKHIESNLRRLDQRKEAVGIDIEKRRQEVLRLESEQASIQERVAAAEEALRAHAERDEHADDYGDEQENLLRTEYDSLTSSSEDLASLTLVIQSVESNVRRIREALRGEMNSLQERKIKRASLESEIQAIEHQLRALADYVKRETGIDDTDPLSVGCKVLLAGIRAPEQHQRALAAVLGDRAKYLVTPGAEHLAQRYAERSTKHEKQFGVIRSDSQRTSDSSAVKSEELAALQLGERLVDQLHIDEDISSAVHALLSNVYLASSLGEAISSTQRAAELGHDIVAVSPVGEIATRWGWYTTTGEGVSFSFARSLEARKEEFSGVDTDIVEFTRRVQELEAELTREQEELRAKNDEREKLLSNQKRAHALLHQIQAFEKKRREAALAVERAAQNDLRRVGEQLASVTRSISFENRRMEELREERLQLDVETDGFAEQRDEVEIETARLQRELEELRRANSEGSGGDSNASLEENMKALDREIHQVDSRRNWVRAALADAAQKTDTLRREIAKLHAASNDWKIALERCSVEREMFLEDIRRLYGAEIELPSLEAIQEIRKLYISVEKQVSTLQPEAYALRNRLEREGEVDPQSIEQFEIESARLTEMLTQQKDLTKAADTLQETIKRLTEISRQRFQETFDAVSTKFADLVPRLFGGGAGHLELVNPEDPLGSGIEIVIRPPGKKIRSLELLSGGEKALTATALLVAMFLYRPSPICVLDEVDAPLDDANLGRFLGLIQEISKSTQFLVITHNKQSMSCVDRLIGITMQESGVSKALSVTIEEAEAELERESRAA